MGRSSARSPFIFIFKFVQDLYMKARSLLAQWAWWLRKQLKVG
jgi:hypothetical protein